MAANAPVIAGITPMNSDDASDDFLLRALVIGAPGSGKSLLASSVAELGPTAYVDLPGENGGIVFRGSSWAKNVTTYQITSITQMDDFYWYLAKGDHPFRCVVVDSVAAFQTLLSRYLLGRSEGSLREIQKLTDAQVKQGQTFGWWDQIRDYTLELGMFWYDLARPDRKRPMHVVMTCQTVLNEKIKKDAKGNEVVVSSEWVPGIQPKTAYNKFLAIPSYVLHTYLEPGMDANGDAAMKHVVRSQRSEDLYAKARIPADMAGKIPAVLGRDKPLTLGRLAKVLRIPNPTD